LKSPAGGQKSCFQFGRAPAWAAIKRQGILGGLPDFSGKRGLGLIEVLAHDGDGRRLDGFRIPEPARSQRGDGIEPLPLL